MQATQTVTLKTNDSGNPLDLVSDHRASESTANQLDLVALKVGDLAAVTLTVAAGECITLAGASGSGKSRLLRAIADLDAGVDTGHEPGAGQLMLAGVDHLHYSGAEWRRRVAYVTAESQWWFDGVANHFSVPPSAKQMRALGLDAALLRQPVEHLSSGERQRLALLRVLVQRPQVLLLDEPTASLDPASTLAVERLIADYRDRQSAAVIWITHAEAQARRVGQRLFRIDAGHMLELGPNELGSES